MKIGRTRVNLRLEFNFEHLGKWLPGIPEERRDMGPIPLREAARWNRKHRGFGVRWPWV